MSDRVLLDVKNLSVSFKKGNEAVKNVSYTVHEGEILGIVGESGSGKSVSSLSLLRLLPGNAVCKADTLKFDGKDLLKLSEKEMMKIRGKDVGFIYQEPMTSLNPLMKIGAQVEEVLLLHEEDIEDVKRGVFAGSAYRDELKKKAVLALKEAGLEAAEGILEKYPHQLSGGMRQRVMIAMAMIMKPKLLIADEPTTALDVTIQSKILKLIKYYSETYGTAVIFISHDLGVIKSICENVVVMKKGLVVEKGSVSDIFNAPSEEYTKKLVEYARKKECVPEKGRNAEESSVEKDSGDGKKCCTGNEPCYVKKEYPEATEILTVENCSVSYKDRRIFGKDVLKEAVHDVSLRLYEGEVLGLVGESGSGKSTLSKTIAGLIKPDTGNIIFKAGYEHPQMVFQDPYSSLNPAKKVEWILEEPLRVKGGYTAVQRKQEAARMLSEVELPIEYGSRNIWELSGGERQRLAIAVALISGARVILLDEPVSALDVNIQAQILVLIKRLQQKYKTAYIFVSHDMGVVRQICDRVMVMKDGEIIERGTTVEVFNAPVREYTKELLEAAL